MSIESATSEVFAEIFGKAKELEGMQVLTEAGKATVKLPRIAIGTLNTGDDKGIKVAGIYGSALKTTVTLRQSAHDTEVEWAEVRATGVRNGLQRPPPVLAKLEPFSYFRIHEVEEAKMAFDNEQWVKVFTISLTALLS